MASYRRRSLNLPEEIFEPTSVATASTIGEGGTFTVSRQKVPKHPPLILTAELKADVTISHQLRQGSPDYVVYKVAQIEFTDNGQAIPEHRARLAGTLLEFLVLTHEPVSQHDFLPNLFGFAWCQNRYLTQQRIPVPVLDWAQFGNLAEYQLSNEIADSRKKRLLWQVATALKFLHDCGIHHGDVKSENVLLFVDDKHGLLAKLSDFGFSVVADFGHLHFLPLGTADWAAPEIRWQSSSHVRLDKADVFSFGLLTWRVFCNGFDPLSQLLVTNEDQSIVENGNILQIQSQLSRPSIEQLQQLMFKNVLVEKACSMMWIRARTALTSTRFKHTTPVTPYRSQASVDRTIPERQSKRWSDFDLSFLTSVFASTILHCPEERSVEKAIAALEIGEEYLRPVVRPTKIGVVNERRLQAAADNSHPISWLAMRSVSPSVRDFVWQHRDREPAQRDSKRASAGLLFENTACRLGGMGTDRYDDLDKALDGVCAAARHGLNEAGALVFRLHNAFSRDVPVDIDCASKLHTAAWHGSVAAYEDLQMMGGELVSNASFLLQFRTCGIGADFYGKEECLNDWALTNESNTQWVDSIFAESDRHPQELKVNKRGDSLLHAAATLKRGNLLLRALNQKQFDINLTNDEGETPLLCALRAGSIPQAEQLLDLGASPCITSNRGESPMHWLISPSRFGLSRLLDKLIARGGWQTITCWAQRCDYAAIKIEAYHHYSERLTTGTPLHWAICRKKTYLCALLVQKGAPMDFDGPNDEQTALQLAAYLHEPDILRLLIERQAVLDSARIKAAQTNQISDASASGEVKTPRKPILGGARIIKAAIDGSDRYSLLVRHGDRYKSFSRRTFRILQQEFHCIRHIGGLDSQGRSALHYAAEGGYEEAVQYIFTYLQGDREINVPYGHQGWTPICEAIHRDHLRMFDLLVSKGADLHIKIGDQSQPHRKAWTLLHLAARSAIGDRLDIAQRLLDRRILLETSCAPGEAPESALSFAISNDAFDMADFLRRRGAEINQLSRELFGGRLRLTRPVSILGRIIASNMRFSTSRLQYLLFPSDEMSAQNQVDFFIDRELQITALHWSLMFGDFLPQHSRAPDSPTRWEIFQILLDRYDAPGEINARVLKDGSTAVHLAVRYGHLEPLQYLVDDPGGADVTIRDDRGQTPMDRAMAILGKATAGKHDADVAKVNEMIRLLQAAADRM